MKGHSDPREPIDPERGRFPDQSVAQVVGKVVAVPLQQVVPVAFVVGTHLLHQLQHLGLCQVRVSHVHAFPKNH